MQKHNKPPRSPKPTQIHQCEVCAKIFTQGNRLNRHMKIHEKEKNICEQCFLEFESKTELKNHMTYIHGIRIFSCDFPGCDLFFKRAFNLKQHKGFGFK